MSIFYNVGITTTHNGGIHSFVKHSHDNDNNADM